MYFDGCKDRDEYSRRGSAWHAWNVMSSMCKPPSIEEMLGEKKLSKRRQIAEDELADENRRQASLAKEEADFFDGLR